MTLRGAPASRNEVHIWWTHTDWRADDAARFYSLLSIDERVRADHYAFERERVRFIVTRASLRRLLGTYTDTSPAQIHFICGPQGKPAQADAAASGLRFNVAHSGNLAIFGFAWHRDIGVDVERIRDGVDTAGIARRFFSRHEAAALLALPPDEQRDAFFACWTRKEAYLKARGGGLALPFETFDVTLQPRAPAALLATRPDPADAARWSLSAFTPAPGYVGACAVHGRECDLRVRPFFED